MIKTVLHIDAPRERVFAILADYPRYKEWFPGCEHSKVVSDDGSCADAEFVMNLFGRIRLGMRFDARPTQELRFHMIRGRQPKAYSGSYLLRDSADGKGTILMAEMRIELDSFVPAFIVRHYARKSMDDTGRSLRRYLKRTLQPAQPDNSGDTHRIAG